MRTSGRGKSEILLFVAPALILGAFYVWLTGDPLDVVIWLDRTIVHAWNVAWAWGAALVDAIA